MFKNTVGQDSVKSKLTFLLIAISKGELVLTYCSWLQRAAARLTSLLCMESVLKRLIKIRKFVWSTALPSRE